MKKRLSIYNHPIKLFFTQFQSPRHYHCGSDRNVMLMLMWRLFYSNYLSNYLSIIMDIIILRVLHTHAQSHPQATGSLVTWWTGDSANVNARALYLIDRFPSPLPVADIILLILIRVYFL